MKITGFGHANTNTIEIFESQIGFSLPDDYKQFLLDYNGGSARGYEFYIPDLNRCIPADIFFGIDIQRELDLRTILNEFQNDLLPKAIIIAHDPGTGIIVLINNPDAKGVYYWDRALYFPESSEKSNTYKISNNFQEFIDSLKEIKS